MEKTKKVFAEGIYFDRPREGAPEFVKGRISIKIETAVPFLQKNASNGYVNLDLKTSKEGKLYLEVNTWKKDGTLSAEEKANIVALRTGEATKKAVQNDINVDDIPFN